MRSARALQEAFQMRSTVAVLGFALRTLGQMLDDGQLDELVASERSKAPSGGRRREEGAQRTRSDRSHKDRQPTHRGVRPDPFARPAKPQPSVQEPEKTLEIEQNHAEEQAQEHDQTAETEQLNSAEQEQDQAAETEQVPAIEHEPEKTPGEA
ncbi:hypothetical protein EV13_3039 [Prochlorococcus sp. MIT 0702]|nr:hypothetical protein EV12_2984 [Prochlorococcus sp. MIT 0701]KGG26256.1 hypothetical protein EV13_3039 [Prochlorococcus sp. MIT 0702]